MAFIDTPRFPDDIAYGSRGGPSYKTTVFPLSSGHEKRNITWSRPRHTYDVAYGVRKQDKLYTLIEYFHAMAGMGHGFRFKDFSDYKSCAVLGTPAIGDQPMESHNGSTTVFRLIKNYTKGSLTQTRRIYKPVSATVGVAVSGVLQTLTTHYTIDYNTGLITFTSPKTLNTLSWFGQFDVPVRFDQDELPINYEDYQAGSASVKLIELRLTEPA